MQRCGGAIRIDSAPGQGSTFTLTLPAGVEDKIERALGVAIVMVDNPRLSAMIAATLGGEYIVKQTSHLNGTDAQLCIAEWSPHAEATIKKFLEHRIDRRALIINCPHDDGRHVSQVDSRLTLIAGWPKVTDLRRVIQHMSQSQSPPVDVEVKSMTAASAAAVRQS
jgi:hypothetical protein